LARTLAAKPKLILADEPTGNLDEVNAEIVLDLMCSISKEAGTALLMVTHSQVHAARMGRRLHLSRGRIAP
jgi:putative ABC transport system ATP-binding protein